MSVYMHDEIFIVYGLQFSDADLIIIIKMDAYKATQEEGKRRINWKFA